MPSIHQSSRTRSRLSRLGVAGALLATLGALAAPASAAPAGSVSDPAGDAPASVPDITAVALERDDTFLRWTFSVASASTLTEEHAAQVVFYAGDVPYRFVASRVHGLWQLQRYVDGAYAVAGEGALTANLQFPITLFVARSAVGDPQSVRFAAATSRYDAVASEPWSSDVTDWAEVSFAAPSGGGTTPPAPGGGPDTGSGGAPGGNPTPPNGGGTTPQAPSGPGGAPGGNPSAPPTGGPGGAPGGAPTAPSLPAGPPTGAGPDMGGLLPPGTGASRPGGAGVGPGAATGRARLTGRPVTQIVGSRVVIRVRLRTASGSPVRSGFVSCVARIPGRRAATTAGFASGRAFCRFRLPAKRSATVTLRIVSARGSYDQTVVVARG